MSEMNLEFVVYFEDLDAFSSVKTGLDYLNSGEYALATNHFSQGNISDFSQFSFEHAFKTENLYSGLLLINPHGELEEKDYVEFFRGLSSQILICSFTGETGESSSQAFVDNIKTDKKRVVKKLAGLDATTAFQLALTSGKTAQAKSLVDEVNLGMMVDGYPLFQYCIKKLSGPVPLLNLLLDKGVNIKQIDKDGDSALHASLGGAGWGPYPKVAKRLIEIDTELDFNQVNNEGQTALHLAASEPLILKSLLEKGADANVVSQDGLTPLAISIDSLQEKSIISLLDYGADLTLSEKYFDKVPLVFTYCKEMGLEFYYESNQKKKKSLLGQIKRTAKKLVDHGCDIFYVDEYGGNLLGYANNVAELRELYAGFGLLEPNFPQVKLEKFQDLFVHFMMSGEQDKLGRVFLSEKFSSLDFYHKPYFCKTILELGLNSVLEDIMQEFNKMESETKLRYCGSFVKDRNITALKYIALSSEQISIDTIIDEFQQKTILDLAIESNNAAFIDELKKIS